MKCNCAKEMIEQIKKLNPDVKSVYAPIELLSGRMYINFTATKIVRGKEKEIDVPILLSKCPFCGKKQDEGVA